jgi:membrane protein implicated in regulation of membrane protease activity
VDAWVWWTIVAVTLAIAEVLTLTFVLGMLAGGAAAAAIAAAVGAPTVWQYVVFGLIDAALLGGLLPVARRHRRTPPSIRTGTARLVGSRAMTLTELTTVAGGRVRIEGETWSARPFSDANIPAGQWVEVLRIDGTYAIVQPATQPAAQSPS